MEKTSAESRRLARFMINKHGDVLVRKKKEDKVVVPTMHDYNSITKRESFMDSPWRVNTRINVVYVMGTEPDLLGIIHSRESKII